MEAPRRGSFPQASATTPMEAYNLFRWVQNESYEVDPVSGQDDSAKPR